MSKPYQMFVLVVGLSLSFVATISSQVFAYQPPPQGAIVELTDHGFNPAVITITVGAQVAWQNKTNQSYTLQSGSPYAIYLPIMVVNSSNKRTELYRMVIQPQEVFGGNFPPNGQLTHQFQSAGAQPYFITGHPNFSGRVIILPGTTGTGTPTASATSPNQPTATPTATNAPNATATNTTVPNATATNTVAPNATATNTTVPNATATNTTVPNATATNTTVPNATATNTTVPNATATNTTVPNATATNTSTATATPTATTQPLFSAWMMNTNNETAAYIKNGSASVLVNVVSVQATIISQKNYVLVKSSGIPNYAHTMTTLEVQTLNARPKAATDFVSGATTASAGQIVKFGENIGFKSFSPQGACATGAGYGYWPPGPVCPTDQNKSIYFPLAAQATSTICKTGGGKIGLTVNGASVFNWSDGQSYNNAKVWQNVAPIAEKYDVDICGGHAAVGDYHHHFYSQCLAEQLGDTGTGHSVIYGFAADGYPIYGPWQSSNTLAKSCWKTRDYSAASSTGCGMANKRTCLLVDQFDITKGTTTASSAGPDTTAIVTSLSGNTFTASSGFYYQDYYYDSTCGTQGGEYLDSHNGHSHDGLGYHYHMTATKDGNGTLQPAFPYIVGPTFYGTLQSNAATTCSQTREAEPHSHDTTNADHEHDAD